MTIILEPKQVYGRTCYYPLSPLAKAICEMLGRKVLTNKQVDILKKFHITIEVVESE